MEKKSFVFTRFLYALFIISTLIAIFILFKDFNNNFAYGFLIGYAVLAFFMIIYIPIVIVINAKDKKWSELGQKAVKFVVTFVAVGALSYGFDYFFRPSSIDLLRTVPIALGVSIGVTFFDYTLVNKDKELIK